MASIMAGNAAQGQGQPSDAAQAFARLMYERGAGITMRTRLLDSQIRDIFLCVTAGRFFGQKYLEDASMLLMEVLISRDGEGRKEAAEFNRGAMSTVRIVNPGQDPALEG